MMDTKLVGRCPHCVEQVHKAATVCKHCHSEIARKPVWKRAITWEIVGAVTTFLTLAVAFADTMH